MSDVEILGRPKYRSLKLRLDEDFRERSNIAQSKSKGSSCDPELVYQRDDPEINQTYNADY